MRSLASFLLGTLFMLQAQVSFSQTYVSSLVAGQAPENVELNPVKVKGMYGMAVGSSGELYISDNGNHLIRKIQADKKIVNIAGNGTSGYADGQGELAQFSYPKGLVIDSDGNLFVIEQNKSYIRKITPDGTVSTFAGSPTSGDVDEAGTNARFGQLHGIAIDNSNNLYVTDYTYNKIKKITPEGIVTTFLQGTSGPDLIAIDKGNNTIYYTSGSQIREIYTYQGNQYNSLYMDLASSGIYSFTMLYCPDYSSPLFSSYSGFYRIDGPGTLTYISSHVFYSCVQPPNDAFKLGEYEQLYSYTYTGYPYSLNLYPLIPTVYYNDFKDIQGIVADATGNLFVADRDNHRILKIDENGVISTFAGSTTAGFIDGNGETAQFDSPNRLAFDHDGNLLVSDFGNGVLRKITPAGEVTTFRDLNGNPLDLNNCYGITVDSESNIYVAIYGGDHVIKRISAGGTLSVYIDDAFMQTFGYELGMPIAVRVDGNDNLIIGEQTGGLIYIVSPDKSSVRGIGYTLTSGSYDGPASSARFVSVQDLVLDGQGNTFVLDANIIRKISSDSIVTTIAGNVSTNLNSASYVEGEGSAIRMNFPWGMAIDSEGNIYFCDTGNNVIRVLRKNVVTGTYEPDKAIPLSADFTAFPNPSSGEVTVKCVEEGVLYLYDTQGSLVLSKKVSSNDRLSGLDHLPKGVYHILFRSENTTARQKLVLK